MNLLHLPCVDDDVIELYAMNRLKLADATAFEEHLLACPSCVDRVENAQEYITAFRAATA